MDRDVDNALWIETEDFSMHEPQNSGIGVQEPWLPTHRPPELKPNDGGSELQYPMALKPSVLKFSRHGQ